ncbi:hypothetical protein L1887_19583 [Cichorium endivia]|nr:hypothetical protein L1887_19583 [Cichorium endivia]
MLNLTILSSFYKLFSFVVEMSTVFGNVYVVSYPSVCSFLLKRPAPSFPVVFFIKGRLQVGRKPVGWVWQRRSKGKGWVV